MIPKIKMKSLLLATAAMATAASPALADRYFFRTKPVVNSPMAFSFAALQSQEPNVAVSTNIVRIKGYDGATLSASGGEYQICSAQDCSDQGSVWRSSDAKNVPHDFYSRVRVTTGAFGATTKATLSVGSASAQFEATTRPADTDPDPVTFSATSEAAAGTAVLSSIVRLTGHDGVTVSAANASYRICSNADCSTNTGWKSAPSTAARDVWIQLQATAPSGGTTAAPSPALTYGNRTASWSITSKSAADPLASSFGIRDASLAAAVKSALGVRATSGKWVKCSIGSVTGDESCVGAEATLIVGTGASTGKEFGAFLGIDLATNTACWTYPSGFVFTNVGARSAYVMTGAGSAGAAGTVQVCGKENLVMLQRLTQGTLVNGLKLNGTWQTNYTLTGTPEDASVSATISWYKWNG